MKLKLKIEMLLLVLGDGNNVLWYKSVFLPCLFKEVKNNGNSFSKRWSKWRNTLQLCKYFKSTTNLRLFINWSATDDCRKTDVSLEEIFGVSTFYFCLTLKAKYYVWVCSHSCLVVWYRKQFQAERSLYESIVW